MKTMAMQIQLVSALVCTWLAAATADPARIDPGSLKHIANISYAGEETDSSLAGVAAIFTPRMDFEQWKPLTGRGDPLRNDPTYDYEPPVLERVHYWADDHRDPHHRKSEVLMLGVSSRKPSVLPRQSPPPRRPSRPPPKYENYTYKLSEHYPMTILVPPPLPPPGHQPAPYVLQDDKQPPGSLIRLTDPPKLSTDSTVPPERLTSLYALQESNLIYQSSSTSQGWPATNRTAPAVVSSDYAGWGPTTPMDDFTDAVNDTHNLIDHKELSKHPYSFYKPMLSEAPPPPRVTASPLLLPTFVPTALPPAPSTETTTHPVWTTEPTTIETSTVNQDYYEDTTTEVDEERISTTTSLKPFSVTSVFDMLSPMLSMPLTGGPERPEDNLYAHASEALHVYQEPVTEDGAQLESMQTMQPPAPARPAPPLPQPHGFRAPSHHTHDPYLHMRFTTPLPTVATSVHTHSKTTEPPTVPMYLIIQGHSKVKTYGSNPKVPDEHTISNEIPKPNETDEVKHLHPIKEKYMKKSDPIVVNRRGRAQDLQTLVSEGRGSIEIQETDVGIKYDVSDGSGVPAEVYRKGIVDADENDYSQRKPPVRPKRQLGLDMGLSELLPDEDTLDEYVFKFLRARRNDTGVAGLLAQAVDLDLGDDR